ncbi:MAG: autotransporter-associated beta strand repeat-containing protein [Luteolibacter sp.]
MKTKYMHLPTWVALGIVMPASADVIYSNLQNIAIPATFDGLYLNVETGAWNTNMAAPVSGWDLNPYYGGRVLANSPDFQPVRSGTGSSSPVVNLAAGASVGTGSVFSTFVQGAGGETPGAPGYGFSQMLSGSGGTFTAGTEGYLGFRLNGTNYGSMRVVFTNNTSGAMIKDWAYDNTGAAIKTGWIKTDIVSPTARTVTVNPGTSEAFTLGSSLANASGSITNSLLKTGAGITTLSQANTYTGGTTVSGGSLLVNNTIGSGTGTGAVTVNSSTTFGGSGTIGGATTFTGNSIHAPGSATATVGTQTFSSTVTYGTGSIFEWDIQAASTIDLGVVSDTSTGAYDQVVTTGAVTGDSALFKIVLAGNSFTDAFWNTNKSWTNIFTGAGSPATLSALFSGFDASGGVGATGIVDGQGQFSFAGSSATLNWTAVPEPSSALVGLVLGAGLLRRRSA